MDPKGIQTRSSGRGIATLPLVPLLMIFVTAHACAGRCNIMIRLCLEKTWLWFLGSERMPENERSRVQSKHLSRKTATVSCLKSQRSHKNIKMKKNEPQLPGAFLTKQMMKAYRRDSNPRRQRLCVCFQ